MAIKGVVNRQGAIGGRVQGTGNVRARQVAIGSGAGNRYYSKIYSRIE